MTLINITGYQSPTAVNPREAAQDSVSDQIEPSGEGASNDSFYSKELHKFGPSTAKFLRKQKVVSQVAVSLATFWGPLSIFD